MRAYIQQLDHGVLAVRTTPEDLWLKTTSLEKAVDMCRTIDRFLDALSDLKAWVEKHENDHILLVTPADWKDGQEDQGFFEPEGILDRTG